METAVFDLETSSLYANSGIILCAVIKRYGHNEWTTIRADECQSWKRQKSDNREMVERIMKALDGYDIYVAHNGQYFDKAWLNSACLKYGLAPKLRFEKFIDPVLIARRHMRLGRNSLGSVLDYFGIPESKTPIRFEHWLLASLDGNVQSLNYIVDHCRHDVSVLEKAYSIARKLVKGIDERGSA